MSDDRDRKPAESNRTLHVRPGVPGGHDGLEGHGGGGSGTGPKRPNLSVDDYVAGVTAGDRTVLARAITLVESNAAEHQALAGDVLAALLPLRKPSLRVGITGVPGAGKSTLVESLGTRLTARGHRVAVTAVDPSSSLTGGSILGDKTRMEKLAADPAAFIRPSPAGGTLGGVARKTRETIVLFEAAGYDVVIVETVGVGQSEVQVRSMVDVFLLVLLAGAGDELQGIKKGVIELADAILVNKADGDGAPAAAWARSEFERVLHMLRPATEGWTPRALTCSALTGAGIDEIWDLVGEYADATRASGAFDTRRADQELAWMHALVREGLERRFREDPRVAAALGELEARVGSGETGAAAAARHLLDLFGSDRT